MTRSDQLTKWVTKKYRGHRYFDHCLKVAECAAPASPLAYEVGLCHDMLEDRLTSVPEFREALEKFGYAPVEINQILGAVLELTDVFTTEVFPELTKKERHAKEAARLTGTGYLAQTVKYADLIDNAAWIKQNRPEKWESYARRKRKLLDRLDQGDPGLRQIACRLFQGEQL